MAASALSKCGIGLVTLGLCASSVLAGINWKAVWLDKPYNPVSLESGAVQKYTVMGLNGANATADLTRSPYLKVISLDPDVVEVDRVNAQFIGKSVGETELRISFSEATSIVKVFVRQSKPK